MKGTKVPRFFDPTRVLYTVTCIVYAVIASIEYESLEGDAFVLAII